MNSGVLDVESRSRLKFDSRRVFLRLLFARQKSKVYLKRFQVEYKGRRGWEFIRTSGSKPSTSKFHIAVRLIALAGGIILSLFLLQAAK